MMQRQTLIGVALLVLLSACGKQEVEELRAKVAGLERELIEARAQLQLTHQHTTDLRTTVEQQQATLDKLTADLVQVKVQRDKLRQELTALKKLRR